MIKNLWKLQYSVADITGSLLSLAAGIPNLLSSLARCNPWHCVQVRISGFIPKNLKKQPQKEVKARDIKSFQVWIEVLKKNWQIYKKIFRSRKIETIEYYLWLKIYKNFNIQSQFLWLCNNGPISRYHSDHAVIPGIVFFKSEFWTDFEDQNMKAQKEFQ